MNENQDQMELQNNRQSAEPQIDESIEKSIKIWGKLAVCAGFLSNFTAFGIMFSYGVFQSYYQSPNGPLVSESPAVVSLIGTISTALTYACGVFHTNSHYVSQHSSPRGLMLSGSILMSLGLICTGWCNHLWQFVVTQGIITGIGASLVYLPPIVVAPMYFSKHRGAAMGIIFAGTGIGGVVFAPLTQALLASVGWRWSLRILGFICLVCTSCASFMVKEHPAYKNLSPLAGNRAMLHTILSKKFILQISGSFFQAAGYLTPLIYMSSYSTTLGFSDKVGAAFISINNAANSLSKIGLGYVADRVGRLNMIVFCGFASMMSVFGLWLIPSKNTYIAFVVLYGIFSGAIIALLPACLAELFGAANYKSMSGFMYLARGLGNFCGSPVAGLFIQQTLGKASPESYRGAIIYDGSILAVHCVCFLLLRGVLYTESSGRLKI